MNPTNNSNTTIPILYEDNHLVIINKPAGLPSQPNVAITTGKQSISPCEQSVYFNLLQQLQSTTTKPNPFLRLNHRLDKPVSGLMVLSKSSKATQRINRMFQQDQIRKFYLAVVCGKIIIERVVQSQYMKNPSYPKDTSILSNYYYGVSRFETIEHFAENNPNNYHQPLSLVGVHLLTGKKHQIRSQLAELGHPIYNDDLYNAPYPIRATDFSVKAIALHSYRLTFNHPVVLGKVIDIVCPLPPEWNRCFSNSNWIYERASK